MRCVEIEAVGAVLVPVQRVFLSTRCKHAVVFECQSCCLTIFKGLGLGLSIRYPPGIHAIASGRVKWQL